MQGKDKDNNVRKPFLTAQFLCGPKFIPCAVEGNCSSQTPLLSALQIPGARYVDNEMHVRVQERHRAIALAQHHVDNMIQ